MIPLTPKQEAATVIGIMIGLALFAGTILLGGKALKELFIAL